MKFTISMKNPEALHYALEDLPEEDREEARAFAEQYIEWGEYLRVEFDTEAKTATVQLA